MANSTSAKRKSQQAKISAVSGEKCTVKKSKKGKDVKLCAQKLPVSGHQRANSVESANISQVPKHECEKERQSKAHTILQAVGPSEVFFSGDSSIGGSQQHTPPFASAKEESSSPECSSDGESNEDVSESDEDVSESDEDVSESDEDVSESDEEDEECEECEGKGVVFCCDRCDGTGETWQDFHGCNGLAVECEECYGEPEEVTCGSCNGNGVISAGNTGENNVAKQQCYRCNGEGTVPNCRKCEDTGSYVVDFRGMPGPEVECDECDGEDSEPLECERCGGSGEI